MSLTVMAGGRKRKLFRSNGGNFYVRFQVRGKDVERSTGTTIEQVAKDKARKIVEAEINGDAVQSRALKMRSDYSTLRQVGDIYIANYGTTDRRAATARHNVASLAKIVRKVLGLSLEDARANVLDGELIARYEELDQKRIKRGDPESERKVRTSIVSYTTQARAIFKRERWYKELALPELTAFREAKVQRPKNLERPALTNHIVDAIIAHEPELERENPACYIAHLLFSRLGLRNVEIEAARKSWIEYTPELRHQARLAILQRNATAAWDGPKGRQERRVPMTADLLAKIERHWKPSPDGDFLVPARHKTERNDIVYDHHRVWVGKWIKDYRMVSYELRAYAASLLYKQTRDHRAVQKFMGHASLETTMKHYLYHLDEIPALDESHFAPAPDNVVKFAQQ
jgi:integrase